MVVHEFETSGYSIVKELCYRCGGTSCCYRCAVTCQLGPEVNNGASMMYAVEGSCYVLAPSAVVSQEMFDMLCDTPEKAKLLNPRTSKPGGGFTMIYAPDGRALCEPLAEDEEGILYADFDPDMITIAKAAADPAGHYSRPDAVRLVVNREKRRVMTEINISQTECREEAINENAKGQKSNELDDQ